MDGARWILRTLELKMRYSIFDSALYRKLNAKCLFPQEKATSRAPGSVNM
jgi:hypothetical protein